MNIMNEKFLWAIILIVVISISFPEKKYALIFVVIAVYIGHDLYTQTNVKVETQPLIKPCENRYISDTEQDQKESFLDKNLRPVQDDQLDKVMKEYNTLHNDAISIANDWYTYDSGNKTASDKLTRRSMFNSYRAKQSKDIRANMDKNTFAKYFVEELPEHAESRWWDNEDLEARF